MLHYRSGASRQAGAPATVLPPEYAGFYPELSDRDFSRFCQLVHRHAGIHLTPQKKELVRARLLKILRQRGLTSFQDYYELLIGDSSGAELTCLLDTLSTNQTAFWREPMHFQFLVQEVLPAWPRNRRRPLQANLWSAGCSSGEEPYTLAIVMAATFPGEDLSRVKIYASDLNTRVLAQAEQGIYPFARVAPLPSEWQRQFFQKGIRQRQGFVRVKPEVRRLVKFFHFNLMDPFPFKEELDIIFCRNVMIYFERETQARLVEKFYRCLRPGGYFFIGHSESLCNHQHRFRYIKPTIYRK